MTMSTKQLLALINANLHFRRCTTLSQLAQQIQSITGNTCDGPKADESDATTAPPPTSYPAAGYVFGIVLYQVFSALSTLPSHSFRDFPGDNLTTIYRLLDSCAQCAVVQPFLTFSVRIL
jgi:hypothetical protein